MYHKNWIIFCISGILFSILLILIFVIKINYFEQAFFYSTNDNTFIIFKNEVDLNIEKNNQLSIIIDNNNYTTKIKNYYLKDKYYYCLINNFEQYQNKLLIIKIKTKSKTIFGF